MEYRSDIYCVRTSRRWYVKVCHWSQVCLATALLLVLLLLMLMIMMTESLALSLSVLYSGLFRPSLRPVSDAVCQYRVVWVLNSLQFGFCIEFQLTLLVGHHPPCNKYYHSTHQRLPSRPLGDHRLTKVNWKILYRIEDFSMSVCSDKILKHATQRDKTLHEGVNKSGKVAVNNRKFFECDLQNNGKKL